MTADQNRWIDGTLESGADPDQADPGDAALPNPETGVGIGASKESSFEPEEDPAAVQAE